jgi:group I intron endonuclease
MIVYGITNLKDGKIYIGQTVGTLDERASRHFFSAFHNGSIAPLYEALRRDGIQSFKWQVIAECETRDEMFQLEAETIERLNSLVPNGYNATAYHGAYWKGRSRGPMSEEERRKRSLGNKGRVAWNKGIPQTYEARLKMRGRAAWNKGVPRTEAEKTKMRAHAKHGGESHFAKPVESDGVVYPSVQDFCNATGLSRPGFYYRLGKGRVRFVEKKEIA